MLSPPPQFFRRLCVHMCEVPTPLRVVVTTMSQKLFSELGLSPELLKAVEKMGFEQASPIQSEAIPHLLEGKDMIGQSQTGSGKTAAFALPLLQWLRDRGTIPA